MENFKMKNRNIEIIENHVYLVNKLKELKNQIKIYESQAEKLKKQLVDHYLVNNDKLCDENGLIICTYKTSIREFFQANVFKKDEPILYNKYLDLKEIKTFLIK
jgi:hypothetical protein